MNAPKIHRQYIQTLVNATVAARSSSMYISTFARMLLEARGDYMDVVTINEKEGEHAESNAYYRASGLIERIRACALEDARCTEGMQTEAISSAVTDAIGGVDRYLEELGRWHRLRP